MTKKLLTGLIMCLVFVVSCSSDKEKTEQESANKDHILKNHQQALEKAKALKKELEEVNENRDKTIDDSDG